MRTYDFACPVHSEEVVTIQASSRSKIPVSEKLCQVEGCGKEMETYFGNVDPTMNLSGNCWPKRDMKECARRMKKSAYLSRRQKEVWDHRMPKLVLDPEAQAEARRKLAKQQELRQEKEAKAE